MAITAAAPLWLATTLSADAVQAYDPAGDLLGLTHRWVVNRPVQSAAAAWRVRRGRRQ